MPSSGRVPSRGVMLRKWAERSRTPFGRNTRGKPTRVPGDPLKLVIDANVLIAALLRDSTSRRLIVLGSHDLHAPDNLFEEIAEHWPELSRRARLPEDSLKKCFGSCGTMWSRMDPKATSHIWKKPEKFCEARTFTMPRMSAS